MLTGSRRVSFHDQGQQRFRTLPTDDRLTGTYGRGARTGLLLGERPQPAERPVLGHPHGTRGHPEHLPGLLGRQPDGDPQQQQLALVLRQVGQQLLGPLGVAAEQRPLLRARASRRAAPASRRRARPCCPGAAWRPAGGRRPCARRWRRRRPRRAARCPGSAAAPSGRRRRPPAPGPPRSDARHPAAGSAGCGSSAARGGGRGRADRAWPARRPRPRACDEVRRLPPRAVGLWPTRPRRRASVHGALAPEHPRHRVPLLCTEAL